MFEVFNVCAGWCEVRCSGTVAVRWLAGVSEDRTFTPLSIMHAVCSYWIIGACVSEDRTFTPLSIIQYRALSEEDA